MRKRLNLACAQKIDGSQLSLHCTAADKNPKQRKNGTKEKSTARHSVTSEQLFTLFIYMYNLLLVKSSNRCGARVFSLQTSRNYKHKYFPTCLASQTNNHNVCVCTIKLFTNSKKNNE